MHLIATSVSWVLVYLRQSMHCSAKAHATMHTMQPVWKSQHLPQFRVSVAPSYMNMPKDSCPVCDVGDKGYGSTMHWQTNRNYINATVQLKKRRQEMVRSDACAIKDMVEKAHWCHWFQQQLWPSNEWGQHGCCSPWCPSSSQYTPPWNGCGGPWCHLPVSTPDPEMIQVNDIMIIPHPYLSLELMTAWLSVPPLVMKAFLSMPTPDGILQISQSCHLGLPTCAKSQVVQMNYAIKLICNTKP